MALQQTEIANKKGQQKTTTDRVILYETFLSVLDDYQLEVDNSKWYFKTWEIEEEDAIRALSTASYVERVDSGLGLLDRVCGDYNFAGKPEGEGPADRFIVVHPQMPGKLFSHTLRTIIQNYRGINGGIKERADYWLGIPYRWFEVDALTFTNSGEEKAVEPHDLVKNAEKLVKMNSNKEAVII